MPQLKAFVIVARSRDIDRAAAAMTLTATEILTLIGELEMAVGEPLFAWRDDAPVPSALAEQMLPRVERIVHLQEPARRLH